MSLDLAAIARGIFCSTITDQPTDSLTQCMTSARVMLKAFELAVFDGPAKNCLTDEFVVSLFVQCRDVSVSVTSEDREAWLTTFPPQCATEKLSSQTLQNA